MERVLQGLQPEKYFEYFEDLSRIPRSSYQEKAASDYVVAFAKAHGLEVYQDESWNVVINKPATPGYENRQGVILQGHLDMVCVADEGVEHDFSKDPIELVIEGDWVKAKGTTLGADNGTAVAMMMMLLQETDVPHPAIQCIFTTAEEVGMVGCEKLDPKVLKGRYLINLDGGGFEKLLLSSACAGNHLFKMDRELRNVENSDDKIALKLVVDGMTSGHSGGLVHRCMGNAIKILGGFLNDLAALAQVEIADFTGGLKMNAIAKASQAVILVPKAQVQIVEERLEELKKVLRVEYGETDPEAFLQYERTEMPALCCSKEAAERILAFIDLLFDGTYRFMDGEHKMARTSCNIGILSNIGDQVVADCLMRSNSEYMYQELERKTLRMTKLLGIDHELKSYGAPWEYDPESSLVTILKKLYVSEFGKEPEIIHTHGGMEPGVIIGLGKKAGLKIEAMNMGVTSEGAHTTGEKMKISAVAEVYEWLKKVLIALD